MKPKYKYDLEQILSMDPKEMKRLQDETQEALLEVFMPNNQKDFLYKVGELQIFNNSNLSSGDYLTQNQAKKMEALLTQRFHGKYKEDLAGFKKELKNIKD
jgi:hypothetical protein